MRRTVYIALISLLGIAALASCHRAGTDDQMLSSDLVTNPNTASGKSDPGNLPVINFTETEHDFGKIVEGESVSFDFRFRNTGKTDLVISDVSTSCGCTVPSYPKTAIRPGQEGIIKVAYNSRGKKGVQKKDVVVIANTQPNATRLRIKAEVIPAIGN